MSNTISLETILAEISKQVETAMDGMVTTTGQLDLNLAEIVWNELIVLDWIAALLALSFGVVYLFYGWRIFKVLVVILFALAGAVAGMYVGKMVGQHEPWIGVGGIFLFGLLSLPLMKWCVRLLGIAAGGVIGAGIAYAANAPQMWLIGGGVIGIVAGALLSFFIFKGAVILVTSLGGGFIAMIGSLAIFYNYEQLVTQTTHVHDLLFNEQWFLPGAALGFTIVGVLTQMNLANAAKPDKSKKSRR